MFSRYNDAIDAFGEAFSLVRWQVIPRCDASRCPDQAPTGNYTDSQMNDYVANAYENEMFIEAIQVIALKIEKITDYHRGSSTTQSLGLIRLNSTRSVIKT